MNLGEMYKIANDSVIKSKNNIIGIDQSAIQMRDVIEQVWGGLVDIVRNRNPSVHIRHLELKNPCDREFVANLLRNENFPKSKILELLTASFNLHQKFSNTNYGKNPLSKDIMSLNLDYSQWITYLDGISGIVV